MIEQKWYRFSGFMDECIHHLDHPECPYLKFRNLDQYQRLEKLMTISDRRAETIMKTCRQNRVECKPVSVPALL